MRLPCHIEGIHYFFVINIVHASVLRGECIKEAGEEVILSLAEIQKAVRLINHTIQE